MKRLWEFDRTHRSMGRAPTNSFYDRSPRIIALGALFVGLAACRSRLDGQLDAGRTSEASLASHDADSELPLDRAAGNEVASAPTRPDSLHPGSRYSPKAGDGALDVALGRRTCVLFAEGVVRCANDYGTFEQVPLPEPAMMLAAGEGGTCALLRGGQVACWDCAIWPSHAFSLDPIQHTKVSLVPLPPLTSISVGRDVACGVTTAGNVLCWGARNYGSLRLAPGAEICRGEQIDELPEKTPLAASVALSANSDSAAVWFVGRDRRVRVREELPPDGYASHVRRWNSHLIELPSAGNQAVDVRTGDDVWEHGVFPRADECVLHVEGEVTCKYPLEELNDHGKQRWRRAYKHGCALLEDGRVVCWGYNRFGQAPAMIQFPDRPIELAVGMDHACVLLQNGKVACWGPNPGGVMGPPLTPCQSNCGYAFCDSVPHLVPDLGDVVHVRTGGPATCAVTRGGRLVCWNTSPDRSPECDFISR